MADELTNAEPRDLDVMDAAAELDKLFAEPTPTVTRGPDGKFQSAKPKEEPKAEEEGEQAESEDEEEKADATTEEAEEEEKEKEPPRMVKVKVDGMEVEVDEEELKKGYSRTSDYTRKTQQLAEERKKFEAEERAAVRQERQEYAQRLTALQEALEVLTPSKEPDWLEAQRQGWTPEQFTEHYTAWKANTKRMEAVQAEQARVRDLQEQDDQRARATRLAAEKEKLEAAIPDLKDPVKGKVLMEDLRAFNQSLGYTDDDLDGVEDHRLIKLLHDARLWNEHQKRQSKVTEKVDKAVTALKPSGTRPAPKAKVVDGLRSQFDKTRSVDDAAKLLDTILTATK